MSAGATYVAFETREDRGRSIRKVAMQDPTAQSIVSLLLNFTVSLVLLHTIHNDGDGHGGGRILESLYYYYNCCCKFDGNTPRNATATPAASSRKPDAESGA